MHALTDLVTKEILAFGYPAIFLLMVLQAACIPIPSEATMALGGALASASFVASTAGAGHQELNFALVVLVGVLGDLTGSAIAYAVGRRGGRPMIDRWGKYVLLRRHDLDRSERWFGEHGETAVIGAKLLPVVRSFISLPAGVAEMSFWRFLAYVVIGTIPFALTLAALGYFFGEKVLAYLTPISIAVAVVFIGLIAWWIVKRLRARKLEEPADSRETDERSSNDEERARP